MATDHKRGSKTVEGTHLPIDDHKERILQHIHRYRVTCIQGETGSGKSTRVPHFLLKDHELKVQKGVKHKGDLKIVVTQPRRIAAKSLAKRVADELGEPDVGGTVGYRIGQEQKVSAETQICFVTTGYMIELLVHNPDKFNTYSHIILDEIHERDMDADLLSLVVKLLMDTHHHPKLIIMSATPQAELFLRYFGDVPEDSDCYDSAEDHSDESSDDDRLLFVGVRSPYTVQELYLEDFDEFFQNNNVLLPVQAAEMILEAYCNFSRMMPRQLVESLHARDTSNVDRKAHNKMTKLAKTLRSVEKLRKPKGRGGKEDGKCDVRALDDYLGLGTYLVQATAVPGSSILIFLPGVREIEDMYDMLLGFEERKWKDWQCCISLFSLHSKIPFEDQLECFKPPAPDRCNVILATNIAESSITLPKINVIIDFGQKRQVAYDTKKRIAYLKLDWCSQASMNQRKGRTGRVCDGLCLRVMTHKFFTQQKEFDHAEIKQAPLDKLVLQVKYVGEHVAPGESPSELLEQAVEPPDTDNIDSAVKNLADAGALNENDENADVTLLGRLAMHLPLDLPLCRMVMFGVLFNKPCDAIVMAATLQCQDPFKQPSNKVMKDQTRFIGAQKRCCDSRFKYDGDTYSEPIMNRNMMVDWFVQVDEENKRRIKGVKFKAGKGKTDKKELDMTTFRFKFGKENEVDARRLRLLEGVVGDVSQHLLSWLPKDSQNRTDVESLINILPRMRKHFSEADKDQAKRWKTQSEKLDSVEDLFTEDVLILHMILAASLVPKFLYGYVPEKSAQVNTNYKGKKPKPQVDLKASMEKHFLDPKRTVSLGLDAILLEQFDKQDFDQMINTISLQWMAAPTGKQNFQHKVDGKKLLVEFDKPKPQANKRTDKGTNGATGGRANDDSDDSDDETSAFEVEKTQVTSDVHRSVHYVHQFVKENVYEYSRKVSKAKDAKAEVSHIRIPLPQQPYRIQWELMSADGSTLKETVPCKAHCYWRNRPGFIFDTDKNFHLGVTANITAGQQGNVCFTEGSTVFPSYKQNLFALLLMLTFLPHQFGAMFRVNTSNMVILEVNMFNYWIPIPADYPLTKTLMRTVNKIRKALSDIFTNADSKKSSKLQDANLDELYTRLMEKMDDKPSSSSKVKKSATGASLPRKIEVNGFYQQIEAQDVEDFVYLQEYNLDILYKQEHLKKYLRAKESGKKRYTHVHSDSSSD